MNCESSLSLPPYYNAQVPEEVGSQSTIGCMNTLRIGHCGRYNALEMDDEENKQ